MQLSLADGTSPAHLDGTTTGIVVMAVVMLIALGLFIGLVYWSAREPRVSPAHQQPASGRGLSGAAQRPVTSTASQGASYLLVDHAEHEEVPRP
jgi:cytoskeletal protein RodZ